VATYRVTEPAPLRHRADSAMPSPTRSSMSWTLIAAGADRSHRRAVRRRQWRRPWLSQRSGADPAALLPDPFSRRGGARLYRTGDLARWCADGTLEFLGRVDHQVKIRGYRIELERSSTSLRSTRTSKPPSCWVQDDLGGGAQLVAYIVAAARQPDVKSFAISQEKTPRIHGSHGFIYLDRIPLTAHGKVDRSALMAIRKELKVAGSGFVAPRDSPRSSGWILAALLSVKSIGVSLISSSGRFHCWRARALARVADSFGVSLPLRAFFEAPNGSALARRITRRAGAVERAGA